MVVRAAVLLLLFENVLSANVKPNIIVILADDLGWNDVSHHGSVQIPTPVLDALALTGVSLHHHYTAPLCTPSRAALMTGKHPINIGMQRNVILAPEPWGLPENLKLMPQYFRELNYQTHMLGKWHLGFHKASLTPTYRGFHSHYGFWNGYQDYYNHNVQATFAPYDGYDMRRNMSVAYEARGHYTTDLLTEEADRIISNHDVAKPLFLYVAHLAPHSGNYDNPYQAPAETIAKFNHIPNIKRRVYAAMVSKLDESVGRLIKALENRNMLRNSIIVFASDNGGITRGLHANSASNWPLKGVKGGPWEGAVRTVAAIWSPLIDNSSGMRSAPFHLTDWLPTLYAAAGGDLTNLKRQTLDGRNLWPELIRVRSNEHFLNDSREILINIDENRYEALIRNGYKYVKGSALFGLQDYVMGDKGIRTRSLMRWHIRGVLGSPTFSILQKYTKRSVGGILDAERFFDKLRVRCGRIGNVCDPLKAPCLFDLVTDPCERRNLFDSSASAVRMSNDFRKDLLEYKRGSVRPLNKSADKKANPAYWGGVWTNWNDAVAYG